MIILERISLEADRKIYYKNDPVKYRHVVFVFKRRRRYEMRMKCLINKRNEIEDLAETDHSGQLHQTSCVTRS